MAEAQRYQVIERLAAGGMAEVYRGESAGIEGFRKKVAIKRVLPKLSANQEFINMFLDEARLCAYLNHSRCVQVFDIGQGGGSHFIVMEFVDGADLKEVLEHLERHQQQISVEVACLITLQICEGLAYAHGAIDHTGRPLNIVHRDISPHNVLMTRHGEVKLVDFGLARASSHLTDEDEDIVKGKFGYLAPEVTLGRGADHRVDIFAAGILLWEMLAGRRLFKGESDVETFKLVQAAQIPDVRQVRPDVNADVALVLARALAREREQRYQTAHDFARDVGKLLFQLGRAVTYQDVAGMVQATADERARQRKPRTKSADEFLGDVIIDALHAFSDPSLEEANYTSLGTVGIEAGEGAFEDPSGWLDDDGFGDFLNPRAPAPEPAPAAREAARPVPPPRGDAQPGVTPPAADQPQGEGQATRPPVPRRPPPRQHPQTGQPPGNAPWWKRWWK